MKAVAIMAAAVVLIAPSEASAAIVGCAIRHPARSTYGAGQLQISRLEQTDLPARHIASGSPCNAARSLAFAWEYETAEAEGFIPNEGIYHPPERIETDDSDLRGHEVAPWTWTVRYEEFAGEATYSKPDVEGNIYQGGWSEGWVVFTHRQSMVKLWGRVHVGASIDGGSTENGGTLYETNPFPSP